VALVNDRLVWKDDVPYSQSALGERAGNQDRL
jgi:hypothetical protein